VPVLVAKLRLAGMDVHDCGDDLGRSSTLSVTTTEYVGTTGEWEHAALALASSVEQSNLPNGWTVSIGRDPNQGGTEPDPE